MVGILGLIDSPHVHALQEFLEIPRKCRKLAVERTVLALVKVLYFMHQVLFGGHYMVVGKWKQIITAAEVTLKPPTENQPPELLQATMQDFVGSTESG